MYPEGNITSAHERQDGPRKRLKTSNSSTPSTNLATSNCANTSTGSPENLRLAKIWLTECREKHPQCRVNHAKKPELPTRLINVGDPTRPFLQETTASTEGPYVALSYCWGEGKQFKTLKENYQDYLQCLPMRTLPRTFADAIRTATALGYTYIWIDAFCITQDDKDDKDRELPKMGDIYQYADFTIYTQGAQSSHAGIFVNRNARLYRPCEVTIKTTTANASSSNTITLTATYDGPDHLAPRGWILQERVLSSRCLVFSRQMSWICTVGEAQETNPILRPRSKASEKGTLWVLETMRASLYATRSRDEGPRDPGPQKSRFDLWYRMLEEYSDKKLTFASDNLKAVSGLAALFRETHGGEFAGGLWEEDLQFGLSWYVGLGDKRPVSDAAEGPSWSWPAVGKVRLRFRSWRGTSGPLPRVGCEVVQVACEAADAGNPFGQVNKGLLTLRTPVRKALLRHTDEFTEARHRRCRTAQDPDFDGFDEREQPRYPAMLLHVETGEPVAEVALDRPFLPTPLVQSGGPEVWCLLLHAQRTGPARDGCRATVLVVRESREDPGVFRRVGLGFVIGKYMDWFGIRALDGATAMLASTKGLRKETIWVM